MPNVSKVILNGTTLMDTTSATATADKIISPYTAMLANGTITTGTGNSGWTTDGIASKTEPNGAITISSAVSTIQARVFSECNGITEVTIDGDPYFGTYAFQNCRNLETLNTPNLTKFKSGYYSSSTYTFKGCSKLKGVVFPSYANNSGIDSYVFQDCTALTYADFKDLNKLGGADVFSNTGLNVLIIRRTSGVTTLQGVNNFTNSPFASNGTGGTLYVPNALISSYQSASNWSAILGYANNSIKAIEGSYYATHYADGSSIE